MGRRRKKPRLYSFARDVVLAGYDHVRIPADARRVLEDAVDAFVIICDVHEVSPNTLVPIARAARHEDLVVRGFGITKITVLAHYFDEAHDVVEQLCRDEDPTLRLFATAALANCPPDLAMPLLQRCLADAEWSVRKAAAQVATTVDWPQLAPLLESSLTTESDARVRIVLQMALEHVRQQAADD